MGGGSKSSTASISKNTLIGVACAIVGVVLVLASLKAVRRMRTAKQLAAEEEAAAGTNNP